MVSHFSDDTHNFYKNNFLNDDAYFNRDLSCSSMFYHKKLENIIKKCTRKRTEHYTDLNSKDYYHFYKDLKKDIENAKDSASTIVKEENIKVKNAFSLCGGMLSLFTIFLIIYFIYHIMAFNIAEGKWNNLTSNYNETQFYRLEEIANDLVTTASANRADATYAKIAGFTYKDGDISEYEATMLVNLLEQINNQNRLPERIDEIMQNANTRKFKEISTEIIAAYETLIEYHGNAEFRGAVIKLKNVLDNDEYINIIASNVGLSRPEIQEFLKSIE